MHFAVSVVLVIIKNHFESKKATQPVLGIEPLEICDVFFTINVYSNALVWLAFAWDASFVQGGLSPELSAYFLFVS